MNFDELKDAWAEDITPEVRLPEKWRVAEARTTVGTIRRNMRNDFLAQAIAYLLLLLIFRRRISVFPVNIVLLLLLLQWAFYFTRFYWLYRRIGRYDLSVRKSVRRIVYELELNIEVYKTYSFCSVPLATLSGVLIFGGKWLIELMRHLLESTVIVATGMLWWVLVIILVSQVVFYFFLNLHIRLQYGRYIRELKRLADDLDEE